MGIVHALILSGVAALSLMAAPADSRAVTVDIFLVLDEGGAVAQGDFEAEKRFALDLVSSFALGPSDAMFGVALFGTTGRLELSLESNQSHVQNVISNLHQTRDRSCDACGLSIARAGLAGSIRPGVPQVVVLMSHGVPSEPVGQPLTPREAAIAEADLLAAAGVDLWPIAIGDDSFLQEIARGSGQLFPMSDFGGFRDALIASLLIPEPSSLLLVGTGLGALVLLGCVRKDDRSRRNPV